jgi:hypothetical protein
LVGFDRVAEGSSEVSGAGGMDWMGAGVAVSEVASDCEQHLVFNFAWTRGGKSGFTGIVIKSEAAESEIPAHQIKEWCL